MSGEIDYAGVPSLQRQIVAAHNRLRSNDLMLDLAQVEFMDSSGLRMILELHKVLAERAGRLVLVAPSAAVRSILSLTGVEPHLEMADTLEEAQKLLSEDGPAAEGGPVR